MEWDQSHLLRLMWTFRRWYLESGRALSSMHGRRQGHKLSQRKHPFCGSNFLRAHLHTHSTTTTSRQWENPEFFFFFNYYLRGLHFFNLFFSWRITALQSCVSSAVQQCGSDRRIHKSPFSCLPPSSHPTPLGITEHWVELPVLYGSFLLASSHMVVCICRGYSQFVPMSPFPAPDLGSLQAHAFQLLEITTPSQKNIWIKLRVSCYGKTGTSTELHLTR